jgi:hypothetical protein
MHQEEGRDSQELGQKFGSDLLQTLSETVWCRPTYVLRVVSCW